MELRTAGARTRVRPGSVDSEPGRTRGFVRARRPHPAPAREVPEYEQCERCGTGDQWAITGTFTSFSVPSPSLAPEAEVMSGRPVLMRVAAIVAANTRMPTANQIALV